MGGEDAVLGFFYGRVAEFDDPAASDAKQMVVMRMPVGMLVFSGAIILAGVAGKPRLGQKLHRPEYRSLAYARVYPPRRRQDVVGAQMPLGRHEGFQHSLPRGGHLELLGSQVLFEYDPLVHLYASIDIDNHYQIKVKTIAMAILRKLKRAGNQDFEAFSLLLFLNQRTVSVNTMAKFRI
jgi:hypothetical protein